MMLGFFSLVKTVHFRVFNIYLDNIYMAVKELRLPKGFWVPDNSFAQSETSSKRAVRAYKS